jgi:hypothetical protein
MRSHTLGVLMLIVVGCVATVASGDGPSVARKWVIESGKEAGTVELGTFISIHNGIVTIEFKESVAVNTPHVKHVAPHVTHAYGVAALNPGGDYVAHIDTHHERVERTVKVPLQYLSRNDRQWVERHDPTACALTKKSIKGAVGTLDLVAGQYTVKQITSGGDALIAQRDGDKEVWTFLLRAPFAKDLSTEPMTTIPPKKRLGPRFEYRMAGHEKGPDEIAYDLVESNGEWKTAPLEGDPVVPTPAGITGPPVQPGAVAHPEPPGIIVPPGLPGAAVPAVPPGTAPATP